MRFLSLVSLGAIATRRVLAQSEFERSDFNATEALLANGVDASILLSLEDKLEGSVLARATQCAIAVSEYLVGLPDKFAKISIVCSTPGGLRRYQALHHRRSLILVGATRFSNSILHFQAYISTRSINTGLVVAPRAVSIRS